jgi:RND superfamily putative drug exporter
MHMFGRANWWLPRWVDRWLPRLSVEPAEAGAVAALSEEPGRSRQPLRWQLGGPPTLAG